MGAEGEIRIMLRERDIRKTLSGAGLQIVSIGKTAHTTLSMAPFPTRTVSVPSRGITLIVESSTNEPWLVPILREVVDILSLPENWDSYVAKEVDPGCVKFVLEELLPFAMRTNTPLPAVVPTNKGGVQLEWHVRGIDLEVEVIAPGRLYASYLDHKNGESWEREIRSDLSPLAAALRELSRRS